MAVPERLPAERCTCTYGWSETARRIALLAFDPDCQHCQAYSHFGIKRTALNDGPGAEE